ncbi:unnamed protein product [Arctogadus glacialis]
MSHQVRYASLLCCRPAALDMFLGQTVSPAQLHRKWPGSCFLDLAGTPGLVPGGAHSHSSAGPGNVSSAAICADGADILEIKAETGGGHGGQVPGLRSGSSFQPGYTGLLPHQRTMDHYMTMAATSGRAPLAWK